MMTIGMYYDVLPGRGEEFRGKFREVVNAMQGVEGHRESWLYVKDDDADSFAILSEWENMDSFQAFIRSDMFKKVTTWGRESVLRGPPRHKVYAPASDVNRG